MRLQDFGFAPGSFGVTGIFTSPTAVRTLMKYGDEPLLGVDHSRVERVVCAGEVLNAPAWDWLQNRILKNRAPVIDEVPELRVIAPDQLVACHHPLVC